MTIKQAQAKIIATGYTESFLVEQELWRFSTGTIDSGYRISLEYAGVNFHNCNALKLENALAQALDWIEFWKLMRTAS